MLVPPYQFVNAEMTYCCCCNYIQMYKNCETAAQKNRLWSTLDVHKENIFSLSVTVFNRREQFFLGYSVSLFHEISFGLPFLSGCGVFQNSTLATINCVLYLIDISVSGVCKLSGTIINSGVYLQWSFIFKGTVFQQAFVVIPFFKGIELIRNFSCSHQFDEWLIFYYKRAVTAADSFKFTVFLQNKSCS